MLAAALAAPGVAPAQASSVTVSGIVKVGVERFSVSNPAATRLNSSQVRMVDNSSRILFNADENLGDGLAAIAQVDLRFTPNQGEELKGLGNTFVGLSGTRWGRLVMGRSDLHYGKSPDDTSAKAGALGASAMSLFDFIGATPIANTSRTLNVVRYDLPDWNGLNAIVAWSANPVGDAVANMSPTNAPGASTRKGEGWNVNPSYANGPFGIGYSYWRAKPYAPVAATNDERGDSLYGYYKFGGLKVGLGWNKSKLAQSTSGIKVAERDAWSLPMSYVWGPHNIAGHYTRAGNTGTATGSTADSGARMVAIAYVYELSKRTSLGATYAKIDNDSAASYDLFASARLGSADAAVFAGESSRLFQLTVKHLF